MQLKSDGKPESIEIRCKGQKCHKINAVVNPEIVGTGNITVGVIGEAPYVDEVELGRPFVGTSGILLREYFDYDTYTYHIVNSINCLTYEYGITVKPSEMAVFERKRRLAACKPFVDEVLNMLDDKSVVVAFGVFARMSLFDEKLRVSPFPVIYETDEKSFYVFINHHPAYLIYNQSAREEFEEILRASGVFNSKVLDDFGINEDYEPE